MKHLALGSATILISVCLPCRGLPEQPSGTTPSSGKLLADCTPPIPYLRVEGDRFIDGEGRQVLLHGMSVISKSTEENYLSWHRSDDFAEMRDWGMNCIRLGIIWDGIEPEPGQYDEAYLDGVAERVAWAAEHGLFVFLDMHQDLFSVLYSDGAPAWATLHEDHPHRQGTVWSDSYLTSSAVQVAFDNFWANAPASDGVGIQDHYAAAWRHVARRFADNPTVIGYDIMNEPFAGTSVMAAQKALLQGDFGARLQQRLGDLIQSREEIARLWQERDGRAVITSALEDISLYRTFVDAQTEFSQAFERRHLQPMYQRVANAIRSVDPHHILLLETSYHCNAGVYSAIEPVVGRDGQRDLQQAYAPHAYDIVVDTPALAKASRQRVELIFSRHSETAGRLAMPLIIGEWGAFGDANAQILPSARILQRQLEKLLCGDVYWDFAAAIKHKAYFPVLNRSIPSRIAGTLLEYRTHPEQGQLICRWKETQEISAPTIVYLTEASFNGRTVRIEPEGEGFNVQAASDASGNVYLAIPPTGKSLERLLTTE